MCGWLSAASIFASRSNREIAFRIRAELVADDLDRDGAPELAVAGAVDLAHPAGAQDTRYFIGAETRPDGERHGQSL